MKADHLLSCKNNTAMFLFVSKDMHIAEKWTEVNIIGGITISSF